MNENVKILYKNHRNEVAWRPVKPLRFYFGKTDFYPDPQWIVHAIDLDKNAFRDFALTNVLEWSKVESEGGK